MLKEFIVTYANTWEKRQFFEPIFGAGKFE
jgi:hypothetical protein